MKKLTTKEARKLFGGRPAPKKEKVTAEKAYDGRPIMVEMTMEELDSVKAGLPLSATGKGW